jgi:hypothetical protein
MSESEWSCETAWEGRRDWRDALKWFFRFSVVVALMSAMLYAGCENHHRKFVETASSDMPLAR